MFIQSQSQRDYSHRAFWSNEYANNPKPVKPRRRKRRDDAARALVRHYRENGLGMLTLAEAKALIRIKRSQPWFA